MGSESSVSSDPYERIKQLERVVEEQEEQIDELRGRIENQQSNLAHRMQCIEKLQRERDELRKQNADLVAKVAQLSRRQSVSSGGASPSLTRVSPPQLPRRSIAKAPSLPPTPASPTELDFSKDKFQFSPPKKDESPAGLRKEPESDTDYSDMEDDKKEEEQPQGKTAVVDSHPQRRSGSSTIAINKTYKPPIVDVTSRSREHPVMTTPPGARSRIDSSDGPNSSSSLKKVKFDPQGNKNTGSAAIAKKIRKHLSMNSRSDSNQQLPQQQQSPQQQQLPQQQQSPQQQQLPQQQQSPQQQQLPQQKQSPRQKQLLQQKQLSQQQQSPQQQQSSQQQQSPQQPLPPPPKRQEKKKKQQREMKILPSNKGEKIPNGDATQGTFRLRGSPKLNKQAKVDQQPSESDEKQSGTGNSHQNTLKTEGTPSSTVTIPGNDKTASASTFEDSTDFGSSFEIISPIGSPEKSTPPKSIPLKSAMKKPKSETEAGNDVPKPMRKVVSLADPRFKDKSISQDSFHVISVGEDSDEDEVGEMISVENSIRSRTATISALRPGSERKHIGVGRMKPRDARKDALRILERRNSLIHLRRGQRIILKELELISPDVEARIREKICKAIGAKYGGLGKATKAAITIQRAYRQYKLKKRFEEIRQEANKLRRRALSMKDTRRRPSVLRKNRYRREISVATTTDPLARAKQAAWNLTKERDSSSHLSNRMYLVHKKRSEKNLVEPVAATSPQVALETSACTITVQDESEPATPNFSLDGVAEEESAIADDVFTEEVDTHPTNLPSSFSSDELLTARGYARPTSVFSVGSSASMQEFTEYSATTLPRMKPKTRVRTYSADVTRRLWNIGVNHFNRKPRRGIEYLISQQVLDNSPRSVAEFLMKQYGLSKEKIGEYLGEINSEFNMDVLEALTELIDMRGKPIDEALRQFQQLFRMPGEAQKIDKIMQVFALEYFKHQSNGLIKSEDGAYMLSFAIMMLHTALHNPSVRHRTTKEQWVSMNRGCNDGENFPASLLIDIYNRIQKTEFIPGQDHTKEVAQIEKQILGSNIPKLAIPQRRFVLRMMVSEVGGDLSSRPSFKNRHHRTLFVFSDLIIVCKNRRNNEYQYRDSFSLLNAVALKFETRYYKNGVQIHSSLESKLLFQCNCDSKNDRETLLKKLEETIAELKEMEQERIAELGTTLGKSGTEGKGRHRLTSGAGDLLSSAKLCCDHAPDSDDFVHGVGDLAVGAPPCRSPSVSKSTGQTDRSSGDSGFDSQQPTPSPSPTEQTTHFNSSTSTPISSASTTPSHTTMHTLAPHSTPPPRSKSTDALRSLTVKSQPPQRSPSHEDIPRRSSTSSAERKTKKGEQKTKSWFTFQSPFRSRSPRLEDREVRRENLELRRANSASPPSLRKKRDDRSRSPLEEANT